MQLPTLGTQDAAGRYDAAIGAVSELLTRYLGSKVRIVWKVGAHQGTMG